MTKTFLATCIVLCLNILGTFAQQNLQINEQEYFESRGINLLVCNNTFNRGFNDEKNAGIELIQHGVRIAQGGAIRLNNTPEQWDLVPTITSRKVDREHNSIEITLRYEYYDFDSRIVVTGIGQTARIDVYLDKPIPKSLVGNAGFNLEFLPSQYWLKTFTMDGRLNRFPRYAVTTTISRPNSEKPHQFKGFKTYDDRGTNAFVDPQPFEKGKEIVLATDAPERMIKITSDTEMGIYDGRIVAQNGWYVLRSILPADKTGKVVTWTISPHVIPDWVREPNIGFSQVGYIPNQQKVSVIELDKNYPSIQEASLIRIDNDGTESIALTAPVTLWGNYFKYKYVKFDFSSVTTPGVYRIKYGDTKTGDFIIDNSVYDKITDATTDVWVPIHMNHMKVNEGYRVWHGETFKEGYLQAPPSDHFDLHFQGDSTETKYKPYELIPGLNTGGFFDAGDFDIETGSNISVVQNFVRTWELFHPDRDETFISQKQRYVDLHRPDSVPDILQFIEHGTLNLLAQAENIGHMATTLSNSVLFNYHHLGDISAITDGLHYDRSLKPYEISADGKSSGTPDDMWAFTTRNPMLDFRAATMFAAVSHALKGYNDDLAERSLVQSKRLLSEAEKLIKQNPDNRHISGEHDSLSIKGYGDMAASLMLYAATGEKQYLKKFESMIWNALDYNVSYTMQTALDAIPYMDAKFRKRLLPYVQKYKTYIDGLDKDNPYGIPLGLGTWAGNSQIASFGTTVCFAHKYYPEIIGRDYIFRAANYLFGCHPYHNFSFVATLGAARPKNVFYGNNRADFSFIPGNMAPGVLLHKPDHFENYDDWPFLWGENEGTIASNTQYIIYGTALKSMLNK